MPTRDDGATPFERLRSHFEDDEMTCRECGYEDEDGEWLSKTDGSRVLYQHICPNCGKVRQESYSLDE